MRLLGLGKERVREGEGKGREGCVLYICCML